MGPELGVQFVDQAYPLFATLNRRFDIVGFDPRGTTGPDAVTCEGTDGLDHDAGLDPLVAGSATAEADLVASTLAFDFVLPPSTAAWLPYVGTVNAARDMDALRAALRRPAAEHPGFWSGTALGATYASLFPTHVRAMVLDGDIDPALGFMEQSVQQGASFEASYDEFVSRCQAETGCPLGSDPGATITGSAGAARRQPGRDGRRTDGGGRARWWADWGRQCTISGPGGGFSQRPRPGHPGQVVRLTPVAAVQTATPAGAPWG